MYANYQWNKYCVFKHLIIWYEKDNSQSKRQGHTGSWMA
jgi:hypothetical protein